jgi:hypothetical protein
VADLYTTWFGSDEYGIFELSFYETYPSSEITDNDGVFYGTGVCRLSPVFPAPHITDCHVAAGAVGDGVIDFAIETLQHGVIAKVRATHDSEYTSLNAVLVYEDGTESSIKFAREAPFPITALK